MSGLEAVEVSLSTIRQNKDFRIDTAYYTTQLKKNHALQYEKIEKCLTNSQYGISIEMNEDNVGYPIYRMNEIHNMLCDLHVDKAACISSDEFEMYKLNPGDVLFNRTNSYDLVGRTGIYYPNAEHTAMIFASYLVRFVPDEGKINSEYLTAYLNSKYGTLDIKRRARQSINQTNVNPEEVKEMEIPLISMALQGKIKQCFQSAHYMRIDADNLFKGAEKLLMQKLGMTGFVPSSNNTAIKTFSESYSTTSRFDAEYYLPKYEEIEQRLSNGPTFNVHVCDGTFIPHDGYYSYIELADIGKAGNITGHITASFNELPSRARRLVRSGQVIVSSIEGSLQSCALIDDIYDGAICSTGFYIVQSAKINAETLLVLFKSTPVQAMMKRRCSGTILTAISSSALEEMPLPVLDNNTQKRIADYVHRSIALRRESERLLESAKIAVEIAIEDSEEAAISWLKD